MEVDALGMDLADDADRAIASGELPDVVVIEATAELVGKPRIQDLVRYVPVVLVASRTVKVSLPNAAVVLFRPIRVADIIARVSELLARSHEA
jgi:hypothetical protein